MHVKCWKKYRVFAKPNAMDANLQRQSGLVSVIIPVFNRPGLIVEAVDSVLAQSYRPLQLILVDDGSDDDTPQVLADLARRHPEEISVLTTASHGAGHARETGRLAARGEFIQYLDSDDLLLPDKLAVQITALRAHPDCGIAYCQTRLVDHTLTVLREPFKGTGEQHSELFPLLLVARWWSTQTPLYRREVCDTIGPWSDLGVNEDWEYEARAGALHTRLVYCPQVLCATRKHEGRTTNAPFSAARVPDMTRLLYRLFECACRAGVDPGGAHMQRFAAQAFANSRRAHQLGMMQDALACFKLSMKVRQLAEQQRNHPPAMNVPHSEA
jgi:hypothetical protein